MSSMAEAFCGAAAVVLAIVGLSGTLRASMIAIATIVLGAAFLAEGGAVSGRQYRLSQAVTSTGETRVASAETSGGMSAETIAGIAGIALGVLSLLGLERFLLPRIALVAFGSALLLGGAANVRVGAPAGGQLLVGIGVIVLGVLALLGMAPMTLTLIGILIVGTMLIVSGSSRGTKMLTATRHRTA